MLASGPAPQKTAQEGLDLTGNDNNELLVWSLSKMSKFRHYVARRSSGLFFETLPARPRPQTRGSIYSNPTLFSPKATDTIVPPQRNLSSNISNRLGRKNAIGCPTNPTDYDIPDS